MVRIVRYALLLGCLLVTGVAFAANYYVSVSGSDSNSGTSTDSPWQHAPGMSGCTANCASKTPAAGDRVILRGGDTWHYNANAGTKGIPWTIKYTGTSASPIYFGVDQTWYDAKVCGSSWCRPILNGDNPLSTSTVSSCGSGNANNTNMIEIGGSAYVVLDDFEMLGHCFSGVASYGGSSYVANYNQSGSQHLVFKNIYIHGWTHTSGADTQAKGFGGPTTGADTTYDSVVVDGSDSDPTFLEAIAYDAYDVHNSVIRYNANGVIGNGSHALYNNLFEYIYEPNDSNHGNVSEWNNSASGSNYIFNNVFRNTQAAVTLWVCGTSSNTAYIFNNVFYAISGSGQSNFYDFDNSSYCGSSFGPQNVFNNTWQGGTVRTSSGSGSWNGQLNSNFFIDMSVQNSPTTNANQMSTTSAIAATLGYTRATSYLPSATDCNGSLGAAGCPVGKGANLTSLCNAIPDATVKAACLHDGTGGPLYDAARHRVTKQASRTSVARPASGAWDAGAFQASGGAPPTTVNPPSGLSVTVQ